MAITWTNINNQENGLSVRNKLNTFNDLVSNMSITMDSLVTTTGNHTTAIATNTTDIATNTTNIETNTADIATINNFKVYEYEVINNVSVPNSTFNPLINHTVTAAPAGTYEIKLSTLFSLDNVNNSALFRFSLDNGVTWAIVNIEPKDASNLIPASYIKVLVHTGGDLNVQIEGMKEVDSDTLLVQEMSVIVERKL